MYNDLKPPTKPIPSDDEIFKILDIHWTDKRKDKKITKFKVNWIINHQPPSEPTPKEDKYLSNDYARPKPKARKIWEVRADNNRKNGQ